MSHFSKIQMTTAICSTVAILPVKRGRTMTLPTVSRMTTTPMTSNKSRPMMVPVSQSGIWPRRGALSKLNTTMAETSSSLSASGSRIFPSSLHLVVMARDVAVHAVQNRRDGERQHAGQPVDFVAGADVVNHFHDKKRNQQDSQDGDFVGGRHRAGNFDRNLQICTNGKPARGHGFVIRRGSALFVSRMANLLPGNETNHTETKMKTPYVQPYLFFGGRCEEALAFYGTALGAKVDFLMRSQGKSRTDAARAAAGGSKTKSCMPPSTSAAPRSWPPTVARRDAHFEGFSLSLALPTEAEVNRAFAALADGGKVEMPLTKTFWSPRFGMVTDRFGVGWMVTITA